MYRLINIRWSIILSFLLLLSFESGVDAKAEEIKVSDYCQLTQSRMELSIREWQERLAVAEQSKSDRKKMLAQLEEITKRYDVLQHDLQRQFGISAGDYLRYSSDHQAEIESYLDAHPDVKNGIKSLQERLKDLIDQFESAASAHQEGEQK
jgi:hypothetical protein